MKDLKDLIRPSVWNLRPYSSTCDEFHGDAPAFLDASENPWNMPYNRYPDPLQWKLRDRLVMLKGVGCSSIFLGNGSDETTDLVICAFYEPGLDNVMTTSPSHGVYEMAANVSSMECHKVSLDESFGSDAEAVLESADRWTKVIFLYLPNNPSGNGLDRDSTYKISRDYEGIVVIDEAYIDFSTYPSFLKELSGFPDLIVLQTLSKAWGATGIRLGMVFASPEIVGVSNKIKYPYSIDQLTQGRALELLSDETTMKHQVNEILTERNRLEKILSEPPFSYQIYPSDVNFLLVNVAEADAMYSELVKEEIIVCNHSNVQKCRGCLRTTISVPKENDSLLNAMEDMKL